MSELQALPHGATVRITFRDARNGLRELDVTDAEAEQIGVLQVARRGWRPKAQSPNVCKSSFAAGAAVELHGRVGLLPPGRRPPVLRASRRRREA